VYETMVTIIGNVIDNPRLRRTEKGADVASFRIASTARKLDKVSGQWVDGNKLFVSVNCWRQLATNAVDSLRRGDPIVVCGRLSTREYEKDGQKRSSFELEANAVGHDLSRGTAVFSKTRQDAPPTFEVVGEEPADEPAGSAPVADLAAGRVVDAAGPVLAAVS
jgi:single-strand DNA-binding protein